ncbi:hypothetical protein [Burkholderia stabilis]|uniref:hypothetical protein n=1 Tax=Burkholderia stabilis TaxID=95485 RepID=UPI001F4A6D61|nr:hypothetical protein [Burkholderia stabilis]
MATEKLSATKLARRSNTSAAEIQRRFIHLGYIEVRDGRHHFTELGRSVGGEFRKNHPTDDGYMVWPIDLLREHECMESDACNYDFDRGFDGAEILEITILRADAAPAPDLPSHLFPGAGSDGALFRVTAGTAPSRDVMSGVLDLAIVDATLVRYDECTGEGYFVVVDGDAPAAGTVLRLAGDEHDTAVVPTVGDALAGKIIHPAMTIEQYYDELNRHDWYCGFSDDYSVEQRGEENYTRLLEIANQHGADYLALIGAFRKHHFSGEPWNTPQYDKPARPINGVLVLPSTSTVGAETTTVCSNNLED